MRQDIGFNSIHESISIRFTRIAAFFARDPDAGAGPAQDVAACQAALTKRGVAVLVVPADISNAVAHEEQPYTVHALHPIIRSSDADLDEIAAIRNGSDAITIYAGAGCAGAHDEVVSIAARLKAPMAHTSRGKDL